MTRVSDPAARGAAVVLRPMRAADLEAVAEWDTALFGAEAWSPAVLRAEVEAAEAGGDRRYVVALAGADGGSEGGGDVADLLGYAGIWLGDGAGDADLLTVATVPSARRRGVATAMLCHLLALAHDVGCGAVLLEVRASNLDAQELYRRHGFVPIGRRRRYYSRPTEDAVVMRVPTGTRRAGGVVGPVGSEVIEADSATRHDTLG